MSEKYKGVYLCLRSTEQCVNQNVLVCVSIGFFHSEHRAAAAVVFTPLLLGHSL